MHDEKSRSYGHILVGPKLFKVRSDAFVMSIFVSGARNVPPGVDGQIRSFQVATLSILSLSKLAGQ